MGFFIAPTDYANSSQGEIYPDATVYLKKRFHDMLAAKYGTVNALNNAWGSGYTTLDSSGTCIGTAPVTCASDLSAETVGTGNGSTKSFSHTLSHATVSRFSLGIFVGGVLVGGDSGDGTIYGVRCQRIGELFNRCAFPQLRNGSRRECGRYGELHTEWLGYRIGLYG